MKRAAKLSLISRRCRYQDRNLLWFPSRGGEHMNYWVYTLNLSDVHLKQHECLYSLYLHCHCKVPTTWAKLFLKIRQKFLLPHLLAEWLLLTSVYGSKTSANFARFELTRKAIVFPPFPKPKSPKDHKGPGVFQYSQSQGQPLGYSFTAHTTIQ